MIIARNNRLLVFFICIVCQIPVWAVPNFTVAEGKIYDPNWKEFIPVGGNMQGYRWQWPGRNTLGDIDYVTGMWNFNSVLMDPALWAGGGMPGYTAACPRAQREALGNTHHASRVDSLMLRLSACS
jgi:hypothetical protein